MSKILGWVAAIAAAIGFLLFAHMFWGAFNNGGMAVLGLQVFGVIASIAAVILGGLGLFLARPDRSRISEFGFGLGLGNILALIIAMILIG